MALIREFEKRPLTPSRVHDGVLCGYATAEVAGTRILQLETYGSSSRQDRDKVSQSIQLDEAGAREMKAILQKAFPGL